MPSPRCRSKGSTKTAAAHHPPGRVFAAAAVLGRLDTASIRLAGADQHPEWFAKARSLKTPYGVVKFHASTKLDVPNEEASIILIEKLCEEEKAQEFLRTETKLNLEALDKLTDEQLKQFRINRVAVDNFSVKAGTIDLGKAVTQAVEKEAA